MATTYYDYSGGSYDTGRLRLEIIAAGLPAPVDIQGSGYPAPGQPATAIRIGFDPDITPGQKTTLDGVVAAHDGAPRRQRTLYAIRADLSALSAAQKSAVWTDLSSGTPPKWALDAGPNAAAIAAIEWAATVPAGVTATEKTEARLRLAAMYVQDNPAYLVHPIFDPALNIDGTEPDV